MLSIEFLAMGAHVQILLDAESWPAKIALQWAKSYFEQGHAQLSRFLPDSELSQLNQKGHGHVGPILWQVLNHALHIAQSSDGLINPAVLSALLTAGYQHSFTAKNLFEPLCQTSKKNSDMTYSDCLPTWQNIDLLSKDRYVNLHGTQLDLGGFAKGWFAQYVCQKLSHYGACLVNAGGDIASHGIPQTGPWKIDLSTPHNTQPCTSHSLQFTLNNQAAATSGTDYRQWQYQQKLQHHIIDPRTNQPAISDILTATVIAPTATQAEAASKILLILGRKHGLSYIKQYPHYHACWFLHDSSLQATTHFPWNLP